MFIVKKAPAGRTAGADCLEGEHVMFGNQYALTMLFFPKRSNGSIFRYFVALHSRSFRH